MVGGPRARATGPLREAGKMTQDARPVARGRRLGHMRRGVLLLLVALVCLGVAFAPTPGLAEGEAVARGGTTTFPPFEVNIDDHGRLGRLRIGFEVFFTDEQGAQAATSGQVREDLLLFFRDKTAAQLLAPKGRDALRAQLLQLINASIGGPKAIRLYFLDYLVFKAEKP